MSFSRKIKRTDTNSKPSKITNLVPGPQPKRHRVKSDNYYVLPIKKCALQGFMSPVITMRKLGKYLTVPGPSEPEGQSSPSSR